MPGDRCRVLEDDCIYGGGRCDGSIPKIHRRVEREVESVDTGVVFGDANPGGQAEVMQPEVSDWQNKTGGSAVN